MYFSNLSQVLLRNKDLLQAKTPLLVNMPADNLGHELNTLNPTSKIAYFDSNYALHLEHQKNANVNCVFSAHYEPNKKHDLVIINFPKSKKELFFTLAMLEKNLDEQSTILIIGENKSGIKSLEKLLKKEASFCDKIDSARHCILFEIGLNKTEKTFTLDDWYHYYQVDLQGNLYTVAALPGVFSQAKLDVGTKLLLENLPKNISGEVLSLIHI